MSYKDTVKYYESIGLLPKDRKPKEYILHHKDPTLKYRDRKRYDEYRIEDTVVMKWGDHTTLHHTGMKYSEETKKKMSKSLSGENNPNWGKPQSEETNKKRSEALKGRVFSEETKRKISEAKLGHEVTEETREKLSKALTGRIMPEGFSEKMSAIQKGKKKSEEHKKKISESNKGKHNIPCSEETKNKISATVSSKKWYNNGVVSKRCTECPEGWVPGRLTFKRRRRKD